MQTSAVTTDIHDNTRGRDRVPRVGILASPRKLRSLDLEEVREEARRIHFSILHRVRDAIKTTFPASIGDMEILRAEAQFTPRVIDHEKATPRDLGDVLTFVF